MKILLLSDAGSVHTLKWVKSLSELGHEIFLFSLSGSGSQSYDSFKNVKVYFCGYKAEIFRSENSLLKFLYYSISVKKLKKIISEFLPDILHAHYATSYGLLGTLSGYHPYVLSVWGSDIFSFPKKSFIHRQFLKFNLRKSDLILSTSINLKNEIQKYTNDKISVIPFGVDTNEFKPMQVKKIFNESDFIIGTVKNLEKIYGIEYLIRAFAILKNDYPNMPLKLLIIGDGSQKINLEKLCKSLNLANDTLFTGSISHERIPEYLNMMDIAVFPSLEESFGVSIIEASACEKPVIATNIGGITETVLNNYTGILINPGNAFKIARELEGLFFDNEKSIMMGKNGRSHVISNYEWGNSVQKLIDTYEKLLGITKLTVR